MATPNWTCATGWKGGGAESICGFFYTIPHESGSTPPQAVFRFLTFWKRIHGALPTHVVFDSRLTTYAGLARLDEMGVTFITLRRRSPKILAEIRDLPASAWRRIRLDVPARKYRTPRVWEKNVQLAGCRLRQLYILDLGHDQPTVLVTNDTRRWEMAPGVIPRSLRSSVGAGPGPGLG